MNHDGSFTSTTHNLLVHTPENSTMPDYASLPINLLRAELARRQELKEDERPTCGSGNTHHSYNTPLHVFALFLILILSTLACCVPIIVRRFPSLPIPNYALFVSRHFGTGVLIATAFVHLLPTAYTNLTDPCLPPFWTKTYPAMAGFIAMCSVMLVVGVEMFFALKGASHSHSVDLGTFGEGGQQHSRLGPLRSESLRRYKQVPLGADPGDEDITQANGSYVDSPAETLNKPLPAEPQHADSDSDLDLDELEAPQSYEDTQPLNGSAQHKSSQPRQRVSFDEPPDSPTTPAHEQRQVLQCLMLEAGILFHSVFIGMAVSVSTGSAFVVLLIAISFHQTFEGLALGSRIASIDSFAPSSPKPWLMALMYGITTPVGQAIGLGVHGLYDPQSEMGLLMVGCVNAVSSGLLLYAGLVQLLAEDFLSDKSYEDLQGIRRLQACGAVVGGAFLMAAVGAFA